MVGGWSYNMVGGWSYKMVGGGILRWDVLKTETYNMIVYVGQVVIYLA